MKRPIQLLATILIFHSGIGSPVVARCHESTTKDSSLDPCCELVQALSRHNVVKFDLRLRKSIKSTSDESKWGAFKLLLQGTSYDVMYPFMYTQGLYSEERYYLSRDSSKYFSIGIVELGNGGSDLAIVVALIDSNKVLCAFCAAHYSGSNDGESYLSSKIEKGRLIWSLTVPSITALRAYGELLNPICELPP